MPVSKGYRFGIESHEAYEKGLVLVGDIEPDYEYQSQDDRARGKEAHQRVDEATGKRIWKGSVTDPSEKRAKRATFDVFFTCDVQPVPSTDEVLPGMRPIELEGLQVEPRVIGQGEYKSLGYQVWATGIKDVRAAGRKPASGSGSASQSGQAAA